MAAEYQMNMSVPSSPRTHTNTLSRSSKLRKKLRNCCTLEGAAELDNVNRFYSAFAKYFKLLLWVTDAGH